MSLCKDCRCTIPSQGPRRCTDCLNADPSKATRGRAGARWAKVRAEVLERDGHTCTIRIPGVCKGRATEVDHIIPLNTLGHDDPRRDDPSNLRASCGPCNRKRRYLGDAGEQNCSPAPLGRGTEQYPPAMPAGHRPNHGQPLIKRRYTPCTGTGCPHYWIECPVIPGYWNCKSFPW